jgi:hypothetical protein
VNDYATVSPEVRKAADATVIEVINAALKPLGYKKDAGNWRKSNPETVQMLNIQKSSGGAKFYINLGVLIRAMKDVEKPKEYECHVRARLDGRPNDPDKPELDKAMVYANGESEEWRAETFSRHLQLRALPFLNRFGTLASSEAALRSLPLELAMIYGPAPFMHFNIPVSENTFR